MTLICTSCGHKAEDIVIRSKVCVYCHGNLTPEYVPPKPVNVTSAKSLPEGWYYADGYGGRYFYDVAVFDLRVGDDVSLGHPSELYSIEKIIQSPNGKRLYLLSNGNWYREEDLGGSDQ